MGKIVYLLRFLGFKWLFRRLRYLFRLRSGIMRREIPATEWSNKMLGDFLSEPQIAEENTYLSYRRTCAPTFFFSPSDCFRFRAYFPGWDRDGKSPLAETRQISEGMFRFFGNTVAQLGFPPDWHNNSLTGQKVPAEQHWSSIGDFDYGDIRIIWEPSRLGFVFDLARAYWRTGDEYFSGLFWSLVEDWREQNPPQQGPHWKCGQEISFRVMALCFGLYAFRDSSETSPERVANLAQMIAVSGERIEANIGYALNQKNNHGISEGLGLWTIGTLFPEFRRADRWCEQGRQVLEKLARELIYEDGSFVQHSVNYHRLMLHDYLWVLRLAELFNKPFSEELKERVRLAGLWLYQIQDEYTGCVPNYGQNDGALILPLNNCDWRDFRPVVQAIHYLTTGTLCYQSGPWDEDLLWLFGPAALDASIVPPERRDFFAQDGGYFTLRSRDSFLFTRCASFKHRPGQADMLHVDLWWKGQNIALDAGTFSYNAPDPWNNPLAHTKYHNTVMVDCRDQMERVKKFLWLPWVSGRVRYAQYSHGQGLSYWEGEHDGYACLSASVSYRRGIIRLPDEYWIVVDCLHSEGTHNYRLHWLLNDFSLGGEEGSEQLLLETDNGEYSMQIIASQKVGYTAHRADQFSPDGWQAPSYYCRKPAISIASEVKGDSAWFITGFGPGEWGMDLKDDTLFLSSNSWQSQIDLLMPKHDLPTLISKMEVNSGDGQCEQQVLVIG
jgi:hypothetical protein